MAVKKPLALYNGIVQEVADGDTLSVSGNATSFAITTQTATAGQTSFDITYTSGLIEVYKNGFLLTPIIDYTANNGTTVVLTSGANVNDELLFKVYSSISITNALGASDIGSSVQAQLISGTNLKTLNSTSLLGSGNIQIDRNVDGGSSSTVFTASQSLNGGTASG